jgi:hypothetical protein
MEEKKVAEIKFEVKEAVGTLSQSPKGWNKELILLVGMGKNLSMIYVIGLQNMRRWEKVSL